MPKPIAYVRLDLARFGIEVTDRTSDAELAAWVRSFHRALALNKPELNAYAAELLAESAEFREKDSSRKKRNPTDSSGIQRNPLESAEAVGIPPTGIQAFRHTGIQARETSEPPARPDSQKSQKPEWSEGCPQMTYARFFAAFHADWAKGAKPPTSATLQAWATEFDKMNRLDRRDWKDIQDMLNAIDQEKPKPGSDFLWQRNILSPRTLRERWNEGKLNKFVKEAFHER